MNRIEARFARLAGKRAFIVYLTAGDPNLHTTVQLALALDHLGIDILELGVPFSDPLADGLVNQLAAQRALMAGTTPPLVLSAVAEIRRSSQLPIVLYLYYNLVHRHGLEAFITQAAQSGVDGLLVLDLPPEEAGEYERLMKQAGLCPIYIVAPTTPPERVAKIVPHGAGFIYCVSREGVTGMQNQLSANLAELVAGIRRHTPLPVAIGFGISNPEQARLAAGPADAVVVGSAIVDQVARASGHPDLVAKVTGFAKPLLDAVKSI